MASPAAAMRAPDANFPGFDEHVIARGAKGFGFRITTGMAPEIPGNNGGNNGGGGDSGGGTTT